MMKKNKLCAIISLLLAATMLLASCNNPGGDGRDDLPGGDIGGIVPNDYSAAVGSWAEYLSYNAPEGVPVYSATEILKNLEIETPLAEHGDLFVTKVTEPIEKTVDDQDEPLVIGNKTTVKWFDKNTGSEVKSFVSVVPIIVYAEGVPTIDESFRITDLVEYGIEYDEGDFIMISTKTYVLKTVGEDEEPLDAAVFANYEQKTEYSYYNQSGKLLFDKLENLFATRPVNNTSAYEEGYYLIDIEQLGKTYLACDGEIVREFAYQEEYDIPVYDEEGSSLTTYAYFEVGGYRYILTEEQPVFTPMGDLYFYNVPGMTVKVINSQDKTVASYQTDCYGIAGYAVLDNGNVFICEYELLNRDATEYDFLSGEEKLNVNHKVISVADGSVTELERSFVAQKLFNNNTGKINSFMCLTTLESTSLDEALLDTAKVKDGYMLAEIQKFADGKISTSSTYAVLDSNFNVVAELPAILGNQFSYPAFLDADDMIISTRTVGNKIVYYSIDIKSGEVNLIPNISALDDVQLLNNGYFWNYKIYDENWNIIEDFTENDNLNYWRAEFRVVNGALYYKNVSDTANSYEEYAFDIKRVEILKGNGGYTDGYEKEHSNYFTNTETVFSNAEFYEDGDGLIETRNYNGEYSLYNINGKKLFEEGTTYTEEYSELLSEYVEYKVEKDYEVMYDIEDGCIVIISINYTRQESTFEDSGLPDSFSEYEYYILK